MKQKSITRNQKIALAIQSLRRLNDYALSIGCFNQEIEKVIESLSKL